MAYRRSICTRATLFAKRINPCFSYISHDHDNKNHEEKGRNRNGDFLAGRRSFGTYLDNCRGPSRLFSYQRSNFAGYGNGLHFHRYMSTSIGEGSSDVSGVISDVSGVLSDASGIISDASGIMSDAPVEVIASQAPAMSEVAIAAADSAFPVAALQHVIDAIHSYSGLNWWASIALTTLLIRGLSVPFLINTLKATSKLSLMRPRLEEIKGEMEAKGMDPEAVADGKRRMNLLFKEYGVTPFTPLKGLFIQGPVFISFFFAISNMAEKVPSFKTGGAFWFTDLTVPDSMYILPVLTALTFLVNVEFNVQEGLEGNPIAGTMKKFSRGLAVLTVPFTMNFPQAIFCYWVTSNIFSFAYGSVMKNPKVKKALGVPEIPVAPPSQNTQSGFSFFQALKQASEVSKKIASKQATSVQDATSEPANPVNQTKASSSAAVLSQRIKHLERKVKQRKKNKK